MTELYRNAVAMSHGESRTGLHCLWQRDDEGNWFARLPDDDGKPVDDTMIRVWVEQGVMTLLHEGDAPPPEYTTVLLRAIGRGARDDRLEWFVKIPESDKFVAAGFYELHPELCSESRYGIPIEAAAHYGWEIVGDEPTETFCFKDDEGDWWVAIDFDGIWRTPEVAWNDEDPFTPGDERCNLEYLMEIYSIVDDGVSTTKL